MAPCDLRFRTGLAEPPRQFAYVHCERHLRDWSGRNDPKPTLAVRGRFR